MLLTYCLSVPTIATLNFEYLWLSCALVSEIETLKLFLIRSFKDLIILRLSFKEREPMINTLILNVPMIMVLFKIRFKGECYYRAEFTTTCLIYEKHCFTYLKYVQLDEFRKILLHLPLLYHHIPQS